MGVDTGADRADVPDELYAGLPAERLDAQLGPRLWQRAAAGARQQGAAPGVLLVVYAPWCRHVCRALPTARAPACSPRPPECVRARTPTRLLVGGEGAAWAHGCAGGVGGRSAGAPLPRAMLCVTRCAAHAVHANDSYCAALAPALRTLHAEGVPVFVLRGDSPAATREEMRAQLGVQTFPAIFAAKADGALLLHTGGETQRGPSDLRVFAAEVATR